MSKKAYEVNQIENQDDEEEEEESDEDINKNPKKEINIQNNK